MNSKNSITKGANMSTLKFWFVIVFSCLSIFMLGLFVYSLGMIGIHILDLGLSESKHLTIPIIKNFLYVWFAWLLSYIVLFTETLLEE